MLNYATLPTHSISIPVNVCCGGRGQGNAVDGDGGLCVMDNTEQCFVGRMGGSWPRSAND